MATEDSPRQQLGDVWISLGKLGLLRQVRDEFVGWFDKNISSLDMGKVTVWLNRVQIVPIPHQVNTCDFPLINLSLRLCPLSDNLNSICSSGIFLLLHHRDEAALMSNQQQ